ncbi:hypothetical protein PV04_03012 [Phialophora macrospora]|uniref:Uncharacterized protein n=1 Tax=Phialophora macrospora TaxID=1851006 RepID=A0A0D2CZS9_9EURO|nr:hypothetical protein PV04_03012 [Phialophora macrospora]
MPECTADTKPRRIYKQGSANDVKFYKMANQDPEFSAFQQGDVFQHDDGQRLKLVYHHAKIHGRQDKPLRPYNPPRESLRFQVADENVDGNNGLSNLSLATGPKEMEQLVGAKKVGDPWRHWKLLRPTPGSDPDQPTTWEDLGTLDEVRTSWNNRWQVRPGPDDEDVPGSGGHGDEEQTRGNKGRGRKRKSTQGPNRKTPVSAGSLTGPAGPRTRTSTQAQVPPTHNSLPNLDAPGVPLGPQQYGGQRPQDAQHRGWFDPSQFNRQYVEDLAFQPNTHTDPLDPNAPARISRHSQLPGFPRSMVQEHTSPYATDWGYGAAASGFLGQQVSHQPQSAMAQQIPTQQMLYQQQTQPWHPDGQGRRRQQADNGDDVGDETDDEHAVW